MVDWYDATRSRQFLPWCASGGIQEPGDLAPQVVGRFTARSIEGRGPGEPLSSATVRSYVRAVGEPRAGTRPHQERAQAGGLKPGP